MTSGLPARQAGFAQPPAPFDPALATAPSYAPQAEEPGIDLLAVWGMLRRHWWVLLLGVAIAGGGGYAITERMAPAWEATASLRIAETEAAVPGLDLLKDLGGQGSEVNTEIEVLKSRGLAEAVTDKLLLRLSVEVPRRATRSALFSHVAVSPKADTGRIEIHPTGIGAAAVGPKGERVVERVGDTLRVAGTTLVLTAEGLRTPEIVLHVIAPSLATSDFVEALRVTRPTRDANIITIRFRHPDPELSTLAPNVLLDTFLERRIGSKRSGAKTTVAFLQAQLDTLSVELRSAEDTMRMFRETNQVVSLQAQADVSVGKLAELKADRDAMANELAAMDTLLSQAATRHADSTLGSPYRRLLAFPTLLRNQTVAALMTTLTELENQRATLLTRRTPKDPDVRSLTGQIDALESQVQALVGTYTEGLRQQVAGYDRTLAQAGSKLNQIPAKEITLARLTRHTTVLSDLSTLLQTRLKESEILAAVEDPSAQIVDRAELPDAPVLPRRGLNLALAMLLGLVCSAGAVVGKEVLDTKVHSRDDLQRMSGVPVLGVIPRFRIPRPVSGRRLRRTPGAALPAGAALVASSDPASTVLEAYRALRTNLAFSMAERPPKIVVITSATPGDGKSTTTSNLAAALAQQHLKVLVIDADMRRGLLHRTLGGSRRPGLSEVLVGQAEPLSVVQSLTFAGIGQIDLITTGMVPPNPAELLSSTRLHDLLEAAEAVYDTILIDTPPVNHVADALIVAPHADGVLLVARGNKTERGAVRFAMEQLSTVRAKVMGTILNDFDVRRAGYGGGYGYYAGYGYAAEPGSSTDN